MDEGEGLSVERKAAERVGLRSIFLVSCNRMTDVLRMDADLVSSAGLKVELDFCIWFSFYCEILDLSAVA